MNQLTSIAWNDSTELRSFLARFSYMFPLAGGERSRAYIFFRGWMTTFVNLCEQIDAILANDKRNFGWHRIREKFGAPSLIYEVRGRARHVIHAHRPTEVRRIDCAPRDSFEPTAVAIQEAVLTAEVLLRETCIVCAAPSMITNAGGFWASLCAEHGADDFLNGGTGECGSLWRAAVLREESESHVPER